MSHRDAAQYCRLDAAGESIMDAALHQMSLSARAHDKILKVARTIANLAASPEIRAEHVAKAAHAAPSTDNSGREDNTLGKWYYVPNGIKISPDDGKQ